MGSLLPWMLPAIEAAGAGMLWRKRRDFPAFVSFLCAGLLLDSLSAWQYAAFAPLKILPRLVFAVWMLSEACHASRSRWGAVETRRLLVVACGLGIAFLGAAWRLSGMGPLDNVMAAHQYVYLALMSGAWSLELRAHWWPALERARNRAYRHGITALFTVYAIGCGTSRRGFVFLFVPQGLTEPQIDGLCQIFRVVLLVAVTACVAGTIGGLMLSAPQKRAARIAGCSRRSNVVEISRAA